MTDGVAFQSRSQAWFVIGGASTCLFCTVGFMNSFGIFQEYYTTHQLAQSSQSTIAWLGATSVFFLFSISVISGAMLDMFGPKVSQWTRKRRTDLVLGSNNLPMNSSCRISDLSEQFWAS